MNSSKLEYLGCQSRASRVWQLDIILPFLLVSWPVKSTEPENLPDVRHASIISCIAKARDYLLTSALNDAAYSTQSLEPEPLCKINVETAFEASIGAYGLGVNHKCIV